MSTAALIELALTLLPKVQTGVTEFIAWIASLKAIAQQNAEWTPEFEQAWREGLLYHNTGPEELPDSK